MTSKGIFTLALCLAGSVRRARTESAATTAAGSCESAGAIGAGAGRSRLRGADRDVQDPARRSRRRRWPRRGRARRRRARSGAGIREYTVEAIPGVIAAGQQWKFLWQEAGNNGDGIVGTDDGEPAARAERQQQGPEARQERQDVGRLLGHAHRRRAVDEHEGRAVHRRARAARERRRSSRRSARSLANSYQGDPLDCIGGVINDLTADSKGGVYFTMGGVYYADPEGRRHEVRREHHAQRDRPQRGREDALRHQRSGARGVRRAAGRLADQPARVREARRPGGGDGSTIDADGPHLRDDERRRPGHRPRRQASRHRFRRRAASSRAAFGGKDKKTLFILARGATDANGDRSRQRRAGVVDSDDRAGL